MTPGDRIALEEAQKTMREALKALPDKKDERIVLVRELIGAEEEGPAFDVLLAVGDVQEADAAFWDLARQVAKLLGAGADSAWLTEASRQIFTARLS